MKSINDTKHSITWLEAARTIDPNASVTYIAIADYYKKVIILNKDEDRSIDKVVMEYVYNVARACYVDIHPYEVVRKLDHFKRLLGLRMVVGGFCLS